MTASTAAGWGQEWGATLWGTNEDGSLTLVDIQVIAENVLRLVFNVAPDFSGLLERHDASRPQRYAITPDPSSRGLDDRAPRPVTVVLSTLNLDADPGGRMIDLTVDRPFSPFPSVYTVTINGLQTADTGDPLSGAVSMDFQGCSRVITPYDPAKAIPSRDFANPQTLAMLLDASGESTASSLGTHPVDASGDYAMDEGLLNLKKRVFRRLMTVKGAFLHAPGYGIGAGAQLKRQNTSENRSIISSEAELQIAQEPDVKKVKVQLVVDPNYPNVAHFFIFIRTITGLAVKFELPFTFE